MQMSKIIKKSYEYYRWQVCVKLGVPVSEARGEEDVSPTELDQRCDRDHVQRAKDWDSKSSSSSHDDDDDDDDGW